MTQQGTIKKLLPGGRAEVEVTRRSACGHDCAKCGGCGGLETQTLYVTARNHTDAGIGDRVLIEGETGLVANRVLFENNAPRRNDCEQLDLFTDYAAEEEKRRKEEEALARERKLQQAALAIKKKFGKNALLKGMNLEEGATARDRNSQIGGHKA